MLAKRCPNCKQVLPGEQQAQRFARNCARCKRGIGKGDKWRFNKDGRIQHRHCSDPSAYFIEGKADQEE